MTEHKVQLEVFEGPLDLLLYLIRKEEVDIYEVNLTRIATQFLAYVELMRRLDLDVAGEFLVMAATLMYIKSRELLPVDQQVQAEPDDETLDPRWDLIRQLVEYKKFKDAAAGLQHRELTQEQVFPRLPPKADFTAPDTTTRLDVSLFDLLNAVSAILRRFQQPTDVGAIFEDRWTVSEKIASLRQLILTQPRLRFSELFLAAHSRMEVIVTFLALLELIRLRQATAAQPEPFGEIEICRPDPAPTHDPAAAAHSPPADGLTPADSATASDGATAPDDATAPDRPARTEGPAATDNPVPPPAADSADAATSS